jgi:hypothetical protein
MLILDLHLAPGLLQACAASVTCVGVTACVPEGEHEWRWWNVDAFELARVRVARVPEAEARRLDEVCMRMLAMHFLTVAAVFSTAFFVSASLCSFPSSTSDFFHFLYF